MIIRIKITLFLKVNNITNKQNKPNKCKNRYLLFTVSYFVLWICLVLQIPRYSNKLNPLFFRFYSTLKVYLLKLNIFNILQPWTYLRTLSHFWKKKISLSFLKHKEVINVRPEDKLCKCIYQRTLSSECCTKQWTNTMSYF